MPQPSAIRDIHVVVDLDGPRHAATYATDLASRTGAHVTGLALAFQPIIPVYTMAAPVPTDFIVAAHERSIADARAAAAAFEEIARGAGVAFEAGSIESVPGDGFAAAVRNFQLSDLTVVGQQDPERLEPMREGLIEALLFQAGVPVFLVPQRGVEAFRPGRVVIAWDRGTTAARAVRAAVPLLGFAEAIHVVMVAERRKQTGIPGAAIGRYLARHGLEVETQEIDPGGRDIGQALIDHAAKVEADWMVMGAYGHSRVREFFLGGATRDVLSSAPLPVFMAH